VDILLLLLSLLLLRLALLLQLHRLCVQELLL
jgi:hypothetical protein